MTTRFPCIALIMLWCLLAVATSASAEEPKGFLEWPWGTPRVVMVKDTSWCESSLEHYRHAFSCRYHLRKLDVLVALSFMPADTLSGYQIFFDRNAFATMRALVIERFGQPTKVHEKTLWWWWPGGMYAWLDPGLGMLRVVTKPLAEFESAQEQKQEERRKKGF